MKVFKIKLDSNNTIALTDDNSSSFRLDPWLEFRGKSMKEGWSVRELYMLNPKKKPLDFWTYSNNVLIFGEDIKSLINEVLKPNGEYLDIEVERGPDLYLFNVTKVLDCINISQSTYKVFPKISGPGNKIQKMLGNDCLMSEEFKNEKCHYWQPVFDADKITANIFFVYDHRGFGHGPYCTDGFFDPGEEFYQVYHKHNMTGLLFEEVALTKKEI